MDAYVCIMYRVNYTDQGIRQIVIEYQPTFLPTYILHTKSLFPLKLMSA